MEMNITIRTGTLIICFDVTVSLLDSMFTSSVFNVQHILGPLMQNCIIEAVQGKLEVLAAAQGIAGALVPREVQQRL